MAFPSVQPPLERLVELLPRLLPRPYSVANYRSAGVGSEKELRFVYSLLKFPAVDGIQFERYGVCSGWMSGLDEGDNVQVR